MSQNNKFGKKISAEFITYCIDRDAKAFESKWFPKVEYGGQMVLIRDSSENKEVRCDSRKEAHKKAREFLKKMHEKHSA